MEVPAVTVESGDVFVSLRHLPDVDAEMEPVPAETPVVGPGGWPGPGLPPISREVSVTLSVTVSDWKTSVGTETSSEIMPETVDVHMLEFVKTHSH